MKITELRCSACDAILKIEEGSNIAECEYCGNRFTIEWDGAAGETPHLKPVRQRIDYTPIPPREPVEEKVNVKGRLIAVAALIAMAFFIIWMGMDQYRKNQEDSDSKDVPAPGMAGVSVSEGETSSEPHLSGILADFAEIVFGRPAEELTEGELGQIQWLQMKADADNRWVGYSFDNPLENPDAELVWVQFPRDAYSDNALDCLPVFTGLKMVGAGQTLQKKQVEGLSLQGISGYFDSLGQVAELVESPEAIRKIEISGKPVSLEGIELFPNLEALVIDSDKIEEERLLVNAGSVKNLSIDMYNGTMDFSVFGAMPWLEELTVSCKNIRDISFLSYMENLKAVRFEYGTFLTLEPLAGLQGLTELSLKSCDELKDMSAVSGLTGLKKLSLELPYDCPQPELGGLTGLKELSVKGFDNTGFLRNMSGLEILTLTSCTTGDAGDFAGLVNLKTLNCASFGYAKRECGFITALPALEHLDMHGTVTYGDISGIFNIPTLKSLNISNMECEINFDKISENGTLESLAIDSIKLYKNVTVSGGGGITNVDWDDVALTEHLDFLGRLKGLKHLSICGNGLTDLGFAASLGALQTIDFSDNYVKELAPLSELKDLRQVTCTDNPVSNTGVLEDSVVVLQ